MEKYKQFQNTQNIQKYPIQYIRHWGDVGKTGVECWIKKINKKNHWAKFNGEVKPMLPRLLKSEMEQLYFCIFLAILCTVQHTSTTKQNMSKGQNTSISMALNMVQMMPKINANVIRSQICDSLMDEIKGFSDYALFSNSNQELKSGSEEVSTASIMKFPVISSYCSSGSSSSNPLGVRQLTNSCRKQKPIKYVMTSQDSPTALYRYMAAISKVKDQRSFLCRIVNPTKSQYRRRQQFNPTVANIFLLSYYYISCIYADFAFVLFLPSPSSLALWIFIFLYGLHGFSLIIFGLIKYNFIVTMSGNSEKYSIPIHISIHRKGTLRKIDRKKPRKSSIDPRLDNFMLNLIKNPHQSDIQSQKQMIYERASILSSIRCRNLRSRHNDEKRKQLSPIKTKLDLRLEPAKQMQNSTQIAIDGKNKSLFNIFVCRRTAPLMSTYSRSKTSRSNYLQRSQYSQREQTKIQPEKALLGYQISSHSPMNRKLSAYAD